jgi:serine/threonine-protein kinase
MVVDAILSLLKDDDAFVRRYAVEILNTVADRRAVDGLIRALDDPDWWVRERAVDALAKAGNSRAVDPLLDLLARDIKAAPHCVRALGALGGAGAVDTLLALMGSDSAELRREAGEALRTVATGDLDAASQARVMKALDQAGLRPREADDRPMEFHRQRGEGMEQPPPASAPPSDRKSGPPAEARKQGPVLNYQQLAPGDVLMDRYRIQRRVGGGGFGTVYLVEDSLVKETMILKVLSPFLSADDNVIRRFVQELRLTRRISHPNVIRIHDIVDLGGGHAIGMEYFPGNDLARLLKDEGRLSAARAVPIALQICEGLAAAHDQGIIHRDVKPGNILVDDSDMVKIVDFGLAAAGQQMGSRLTKSGLVIGTPEYIAPEQIKGSAVDARADIYSLGVLLYEMLSGVQPFTGENSVNILFQHLEGDYRPLREHAPEVSESLAKVVGLAMSREPENRPASVNQLRQMLAAA